MRYLLLLILFATACKSCGGHAPIVPKVNEPCPQGLHTWGNEDGVYHLAHDALTPYIVDESPTYDFNIDDWNALNTQVKFAATGGSFPITYEDVHLPDAGYLGLATVTIGRGNHILRAGIKMNVPLLNKYGPNVWRHVSCQEGGHLLGLGHDRDDLSTCMNDCQATTSSRDWLACIDSDVGVTPGGHDEALLREIYEHVEAAPPHKPGSPCARTLILHEFSDYGQAHDHEH